MNETSAVVTRVTAAKRREGRLDEVSLTLMRKFGSDGGSEAGSTVARFAWGSPVRPPKAPERVRTAADSGNETPTPMNPEWADNMELAGPIEALELAINPPEPETGGSRDRYGDGPFAPLKMPPLADQPRIYVWESNGSALYVGRARTGLRVRLSPNGYSTITRYSTYARGPDRRNDGQQTNCRINALANRALESGAHLNLWIRVATDAATATTLESEWMRHYGKPPWNLSHA